MNLKRIFSLTLILWALVAFVIPVTASAAESTDDLSVYFRPAVRFGTDDRVLFILDFLVPVYRGNSDILFVNAKFTPATDEAWETNAGIGYRRMLSDKLVLGGNLFYDHRKTTYGSHFNQLGLGLEAMADVNGLGLTTRMNYYQPLNKAKLGEDFGYVFAGNGIYTAGIEEPMTGFDYEAGARIPWVSDYVETWAYAGGYHYFGSHVPDVNGFSARIEAMPTDFVRLNFEYRNDNINHDECYGEVALEIPFSITNLVAGKDAFEGIGDVLTGSRSLKERMVEPVHRDVDIVVGKDYLTGSDAGDFGTLMDGVIFVADDADTGGDGSYEHPYTTLTEAAGDSRLGSTISVVHVLAGDGTGTGGASFGQAGITIWGAGADNPAYPNIVNFVQGYPLITSTLTMDGQDQTVLGLYFSNPGTYGIYVGSGAGGSALSIFSNVIEGAGRYGIYYKAAGVGVDGSPTMIYDNRITNTAGGSSSAGIYLTSSGDTYAEIFGNDIETVIGAGGASSANGASGIYVNGSGGFFGTISNNLIADIYSSDVGMAYGIRASFYANVAGSISDNDISGVESYGGKAYGINTYSNHEYFYANVDGNMISTVSGKTYAGGILTSSYKDYTGSISNNTITDVRLTSSTLSSYYAEGIFFNIDGSFTGTVSGNTITNIINGIGNDANGIYGDADGAMGGTITGNTLTGIISAMYATGIYLHGSSITTAVTNNVIEVTGGTKARALYASTYRLGTLSSPMLFTGNSGSVDAPTAYLAYIYTAYPDLSSVLNEDNLFTTTGTWKGNYPYTDGPIWASDSGSFINR